MKTFPRQFARHPQSLALLCALALCGFTPLMSAPVHLVDEPPVAITKLNDGVILIDFGKVAFGNLKLMPPADAKETIRVHFGEALSEQRINRKPPGTVRYALTEATLNGQTPLVVAPPKDGRNTHQPAAVLTPPEFGVVMPFRWVEIEGWQGDFKPSNIQRQSAFLAAWNDKAASFVSSDPTLNQIWELCRYSIKATSFAGIYVDGDRERIAYEADAYINQLGHYASDNDIQMARDTFDRLMKYPTWPTEWAPHMIFMAHADWMHNGDAAWLQPRYEALKKKMLQDRVNPDGWVTSETKQQKHDDIVDWPGGERDKFQFREVNTVVNAFYLAAVKQMADLARAVGKENEAADFEKRYQEGRERFNKALFVETEGAYRDGIGTDHTSSHASLFPLAFGLVPENHTTAVAEFLAKRGMTCSVYASQYLLEGLFHNGAGKAAIDLITAKNDRSWRHMLESGTTITWEAWDQKYKPNQDWNHAWGSAPANLLPRFVLGAEPATPGWKTARIAPLQDGLSEATGQIPTPLGPLQIHWTHSDSFQLEADIPAGMQASIELPSTNPKDRVLVDGKDAAFTRKGSRLVLNEPVSGKRKFTVTSAR